MCLWWWCPDPAMDMEILGPFLADEPGQGFYDYDGDWWAHPDHWLYFQYNLTEIPDPFIQEEGTIYWLELCVDTGLDYWGWKTSADHFMDGAVAYCTDALYDPSDVAVVDTFAADSTMLVPPGPVEDPDGTGYESSWYYYEETEWWNEWFYDHPYDPARDKVIDVEFDITGVGADPVEFVVNWSTPEWSLEGNPPDEPRVPPLPPLTPAEEDLYIERSDPVEVIDVDGHYAFHYVIPEYNPEWVSVDITNPGDGEEELDQYQEYCEECEHVGPLYWDSWQEFVPTANNLTRVEVKIARTLEYPSTASIAMTIESPLGIVLTSATLQYWEVPELPWCETVWVSFNVPDIPLTPGQSYYIVLSTEDLAYHWCFVTWDAYPSGGASPEFVGDWTFRTYYDEDGGFVISNGIITHQCRQPLDLAFVITGEPTVPHRPLAEDCATLGDPLCTDGVTPCNVSAACNIPCPPGLGPCTFQQPGTRCQANPAVPCMTDDDCRNQSICVPPPLGQEDDPYPYDYYCYAPKLRYISIKASPKQVQDTARRIKLDAKWCEDNPALSCMTDQDCIDAGAAGPCIDVLGWVGQPYPDGSDVHSSPYIVAQVVPAPYYAPTWPDIVHVHTCEIAHASLCDITGVHCKPNLCPGDPVEQCINHRYGIQAIVAGANIANEANYSEALWLNTGDTWGDTVGSCAGNVCEPADSLCGLNDIMAAIAYFTGCQDVAPLVWLDIDPSNAAQCPEQVIGLGDIMSCIAGFQGAAYPGLGPKECP